LRSARGYFELRRDRTNGAEIVYFGLLPEFTGRGLGGHMLTSAAEAAWSQGSRACLAAHEHDGSPVGTAELPEARVHRVSQRRVHAGSRSDRTI
jgi:GNAT superfamily N-acetyltransferase